MPYEQRDNSGSLFRNDKRESENHPNANGKAMIGGTMYWVSAWTKRKVNGEPWQSLSFTPMEQQQTAAEPQKQADSAPEFDDEIPFS